MLKCKKYERWIIIRDSFSAGSSLNFISYNVMSTTDIRSFVCGYPMEIGYTCNRSRQLNCYKGVV